MKREPVKAPAGKLLAAYHQGFDDAQARKAPRPPSRNPYRDAYTNGYRDGLPVPPGGRRGPAA